MSFFCFYNSVDAKEVGRGRIEIDSDLPVLRYDKVSEKCYRVSFVPKKAGLHDLVVKYNDRVVGGKILQVLVTATAALHRKYRPCFRYSSC